jgi:DNA-binding CsgD family transcriptional regulator
MCSGILSLNDPGVGDLLDDHAALAVWEQLRLARRALDLRGVAARCAVEHVDALRAIDRLTAAGLAERVDATRRGGTRWRISCDRIVVAFDPPDRAHAAALAERLESTRSSQVSELVARFGVRSHDRANSCSHRRARTVRLAPEDLPELSRRIQAVHDFLSLVGKRASSRARTAPAYCNHAVHVNVDPLSGPVLPQPEIEIVPRAQAEQNHAGRGRRGGPRGLSRREHDVAVAMSRGLTRPQIAQALGVSGNTVGTLSLRIYRKLGVRTRLELAHAMQALSPPNGDDGASKRSGAAG